MKGCCLFFPIIDMSFAVAYAHLEKLGLADRVHTFDASTATVELAAQQLGCDPARIAKSMAFLTENGPVIVLAAGDVKVDNRKFKDTFHTKAKMIPGEEVEALIGHAPGGVCPFGVREGVTVYLDRSIDRFDIVYPACGDAASGVRLTPEELYRAAGAVDFVDVTKPKN